MTENLTDKIAQQLGVDPAEAKEGSGATPGPYLDGAEGRRYRVTDIYAAVNNKVENFTKLMTKKAENLTKDDEAVPSSAKPQADDGADEDNILNLLGVVRWEFSQRKEAAIGAREFEAAAHARDWERKTEAFLAEYKSQKWKLK